MKRILQSIFAMLLVGTLAVSAQDKIYKKGGEVIEAKVIEVGSNEIKYRIFTDQSGPLYTLQKQQLIKIVYENGRLENYDASSDTVVENTNASIEKRAQNVFVELGAQGLLFTANYDTRFGNKRNGLGGRIGIGYLSIDGSSVITAPISLNYLLGKGNKFFEMGLGATYLGFNGSEESFFDQEESTVLGTMSFMFRYQPVETGFSFRGGLTPIFNSDFFLPYYFGISLGYTF